MVSELGQYIDAGIYTSEPEGIMYRLWGEKIRNSNGKVKDIDLLGISVHSNIDWSDFNPGFDDGDRFPNPNTRSFALEAISEITNRLEIPLIWFGENDVNYDKLAKDTSSASDMNADYGDRVLELGELVQNNDGDHSFDASDVSEIKVKNAKSKIGEIFGTDFNELGASKDIKDSVTNFHRFTKRYFPSEFCIQDIDALCADNPQNPVSLIEMKRAGQPAEKWTPYPNDTQQYYMMIKAAQNADLKPVVVKYQKKPLKHAQLVRFYDDVDLPVLPKEFESIASGDHLKAKQYFGKKGELIPCEMLSRRIRKVNSWSNSSQSSQTQNSTAKSD